MNLKQIKQINKEISRLRSKILRIESEACKITATISDLPGAGEVSDKVGNKATEIAYLQAEIHSLEAQKSKAINLLPMNTLEGNCIYMRLKHHYSWTKIAMQIGGNNTADGIRKACERYSWYT